MNTPKHHRDRTNVSIAFVIKAPRRYFETIQDSITQNFPDAYVAYKCWDNGRLKIVRELGDPALRRRGRWEDDLAIDDKGGGA